MQHEQQDYDGDNLAEIWRSAQHRRTQDIYSWFTHFFERRRQPDQPVAYLNIPKVTPAHWETARRAATTAATMRSHSLPAVRAAGTMPLQEPQTAAGVNKLPIEDVEDMSLVYSTATKR